MNIVITGASRGIGFDTAIELSLIRGNHIVALSRNADGLAALKEKANLVHGNIDTITADLEHAGEAELAGLLAPYGHIDVLINNAGQLLNKKFTALSTEDWRKLFDINLFGTIKMIRASLPLLRRSALAHIVNIGSMGGYQGTSKFAGLSAYSASKAAIANLTECLAEELKEENIRVNCLALGSVNTAMLQDAFPDYLAPVTSQDMARFIAHFSQHSHHFMNGKIIPVSVSTP